MRKTITRTAARLVERVLPAADASATCGSFRQYCGCLRYSGSQFRKYYRNCAACSDGSVTCSSYCTASSISCPNY